MEQKRKKSLIALFCIFLILLAVYFGLQSWNKKQEKRQQEKTNAETVYVTDIDDITKIKYDVGDGEVSV